MGCGASTAKHSATEVVNPTAIPEQCSSHHTLGRAFHGASSGPSSHEKCSPNKERLLSKTDEGISASFLRRKLGLTSEGDYTLPEVPAHLTFSMTGPRAGADAYRQYEVGSSAPSLEVSWTVPRTTSMLQEATSYILEILDDRPIAEETDSKLGLEFEARKYSFGSFGHRRVFEGSENKCSVASVNRGRRYVFRLLGVSEDGEHLWQSTATFVCSSDAPSPPPVPKLVEKAARRAVLQFFMAEPNGSPLTRLSVERVNVLSEGDIQQYEFSLEDSPKKKANRQSKTLEIEMEDLRPNTSYKVCACCENKIGRGAWSQPLFVVTNPDVPERVESLRANNVAETSADLLWDIPKCNGRDILRYEVELMTECGEREKEGDDTIIRYEAAGEISFLVPISKFSVHLHHMQAATHYCMTDLLSATKYGMRVAAVNAIGRGEWSEIVTFTTTAGAPSLLLGIKVVSIGATCARVEWKTPSGNGSPISSYRVRLLENPSAELHRSNDEEVSGKPKNTGPPTLGCIVYEGSAREARLTQLRPKTAYAVFISAKNAIGWGPYSRPTLFETEIDTPSAPHSLIAESVTDSTALVKWEEPNANGSPILEYMLEMCCLQKDSDNLNSDDKRNTRDGGKSDETSGVNMVSQTVQAQAYAFKRIYNGAERRYQIFGLRPAAKYGLRAFASNSAGVSSSSSITVIQTQQARGVCDIRFAHLKFGNALGEGAFSVVYDGEWNGRRVAIKKLKETDMSDDSQKKFKREITLLSRLEHPNIVKYIGACSEPPNLCVVTELMTRGSLYELLYKHKSKFGLGLMLRIAKNIAAGCEYLHSLQPIIIHRDLKSSNILIDEHWNAKIADFGLSKFKSEVSQTSGALGTPGWTAPEIYRNEKYDESVDAYSFGIILKELLTGEKPYPDLNAMQIAFATVYKGVRPSLPDSIPVSLRNLIKACWDVDPSRRPKFKKILQSLSKFESTISKPQLGRKMVTKRESFDPVTVSSAVGLAAHEDNNPLLLPDLEAQEADRIVGHQGDPDQVLPLHPRRAADLNKLARVSPRRVRQRQVEDKQRSMKHHHHRPENASAPDTKKHTTLPGSTISGRSGQSVREESDGGHCTPVPGPIVPGDVLREEESPPRLREAPTIKQDKELSRTRETKNENHDIATREELKKDRNERVGSAGRQGARKTSPPPSRLRSRVPSAARVRRSNDADTPD